MDIFCFFVIFGFILFMCLVWVLGVFIVVLNLVEDIVILKNNVLDIGFNVVE